MTELVEIWCTDMKGPANKVISVYDKNVTDDSIKHKRVVATMNNKLSDEQSTKDAVWLCACANMCTEISLEEIYNTNPKHLAEMVRTLIKLQENPFFQYLHGEGDVEAPDAKTQETDPETSG